MGGGGDCNNGFHNPWAILRIYRDIFFVNLWQRIVLKQCPPHVPEAMTLHILKRFFSVSQPELPHAKVNVQMGLISIKGVATGIQNHSRLHIIPISLISTIQYMGATP
jgi:hypothetical protein